MMMRCTLSMMAFSILLSGWCGVAVADGERRYALIVGHNVGRADELVLKYAEEDAKRVADLLVELGSVQRKDTLLLLAPTPTQLTESLDQIAQKLASAPPSSSTTVFFYFAGHGDDTALHLERERYNRNVLVQRISAMDADVKLSIIDACQTADTTRTRGVQVGPSFDVSMVQPNTPQGAIVIQSSSVGEPALESDGLRGAVFTHYFLSALRGAADIDKDGRVTLLEAYGFAYSRTVKRSAAHSSVVQHPSFDIELSGSEELVLTRPSAASSSVVLSGVEDSRFTLFTQPTGTLIAEVLVKRGTQTAIAVPSGRLWIQRRTENTIDAAEIWVRSGEQYPLEEYEFEEVDTETMKRRGPQMTLAPNDLMLAFLPAADYVSTQWISRLGVQLSYWRTIGAVSAGLLVEGAFSSYPGDLYRTFDALTTVGAVIGHRFFFKPVEVALYAGPLLLIYLQRRTRTDADRFNSIEEDFSVTEHNRTFAPGGMTLLYFWFRLPKHFSLILGGEASFVALNLSGRQESRLRFVPGVRGVVGLGVRF